MENINLKIGTKIELELVDKAGQKIGQTYLSQILDILNDGSFMLAAPIHEARLTFILPGTLIRIIFLDNVHGLLSFTGVITKREKSGNIMSFYVKRNDEFKKIQRRQYFRFEYNLPVHYAHCEDNLENQEMYAELLRADSKKALTKDISGCGACIITEENFKKNDLLALEVALPAGTKINALCKVIRSQLIEGRKDKKYQVGLYFTKISGKDREYLVKFIFDQERLLLKKASGRK